MHYILDNILCKFLAIFPDSRAKALMLKYIVTLLCNYTCVVLCIYLFYFVLPSVKFIPLIWNRKAKINSALKSLNEFIFISFQFNSFSPIAYIYDMFCDFFNSIIHSYPWITWWHFTPSKASPFCSYANLLTLNLTWLFVCTCTKCHWLSRDNLARMPPLQKKTQPPSKWGANLQIWDGINENGRLCCLMFSFPMQSCSMAE